MSYKDKPDTVPFDESAIREYLDRVIVHWRARKEECKCGENNLIASCYIDAYQSVRISIFGETLR